MSRTPALPLTQAQTLRRRCQRLLADHRRRAKAEGAVLDYGLGELMFMGASQLGCAYCNCFLAGDFSVDHLQPVARGGKHALFNLTLCCGRCNRLKGKITASEFRQLLALLASWHPAARDDTERRLLSGSRVYTGSRKGKGKHR